MTFWAALLALLWDQLVPLFRPGQLDRLFGRYADWMHDRFNAGTPSHGLLAWLVAVAPIVLAVWLVEAWLAALAWPLGLAWSALVLYRCLGFRQVVDLARGLADTLVEPDRARDPLAVLGVHEQAAGIPGMLAREVMDRLFELGLRRLFGVLFWFAVLGGAGAAAYAMTQLVAERWPGDEAFHATIRRVVATFDWLPARALAFSFALVGNFEEAMLAWRANAGAGAEDETSVVRLAGYGALGLGEEPASADYVAGVAGLFNRAALLWLAVLGLLWLGMR